MSYEKMVEEGRWPPTKRETILFWMGFLLGGFIGWAMTAVFTGAVK